MSNATPIPTGLTATMAVHRCRYLRLKMVHVRSGTSRAACRRKLEYNECRSRYLDYDDYGYVLCCCAPVLQPLNGTGHTQCNDTMGVHSGDLNRRHESPPDNGRSPGPCRQPRSGVWSTSGTAFHTSTGMVSCRRQHGGPVPSLPMLCHGHMRFHEA